MPKSEYQDAIDEIARATGKLILACNPNQSADDDDVSFDASGEKEAHQCHVAQAALNIAQMVWLNMRPAQENPSLASLGGALLGQRPPLRTVPEIVENAKTFLTPGGMDKLLGELVIARKELQEVHDAGKAAVKEAESKTEAKPGDETQPV